MTLSGLRVLIVEDEPLLQLELADMLEEWGCQIAGTAGRVGTALQIADEAEFDVALLDVNLAGENVDPVVRELERRGTPFLFLTGYGAKIVAGRHRPVAVDKPYDHARIREAIVQVLKGNDE